MVIEATLMVLGQETPAELLIEQLESKDPDITEIQRGMVPTPAAS